MTYNNRKDAESPSAAGISHLEIEHMAQWHPAFCSAMELELRDNKDCLVYSREHSLSKKPLQIDLLVIKKKPEETIKNEIGDFFLGNNLLEYKSPDDELNIDTFYKVLSYACLYKAETGKADEILDTDITVSLIRERKPIKLLKQLSEKYLMTEKGPGIYRIDKMLFPMQVIVTKELDPVSHIWLKSLTRSMGRAEAKELLDNYAGLEDAEDRLNADAVVDLVSDVNSSLFEQIVREGGLMSEALKELIEPELAKLRIIIADNAAKLADKDAKLADNAAKLADNAAEIARLKHQLAKAEKRNKNSL